MIKGKFATLNMEKFNPSNSVRPRQSDWDIESPNFNMYGRRQSTGSSYSRKGMFGHKPLSHNLSLDRVYEDEQDGDHDTNKMKTYSGPKLQTYLHRSRESFLYRSVSEFPKSSSRCSHSSSPASEDGQERDLFILTPFAQVLTKLHSIRSNFEHILNIISEEDMSFAAPPRGSGSAKHKTNSSKHQVVDLKDSLESLVDLDWCLTQLETLCSHQSVADMTRQKFTSLLDQEITKLSKSRSGNEISEFIMNTYTDFYKSVSLKSSLSRKNSAPSRLSRDSHANLLMPNLINRGSQPFTIEWKLSQKETILDKSVPLPKYGVFTTKEDELGTHLKQVNNWGLDIFLLYDLAKGFPLTSIAYQIFQERNILREFQIHPTTMLSFFTSLEKSYLSVSYHNSKHASDVLQSSHVLLNVPTLQNLFSLLEITAALFAAAIHDVGHPGVTNQYLINAQSELALLYNDYSILENHHVSIAFKLLQNRHLDMFSNMSREEQKILRKTVIDIVLATDMTKHMTILANMQTMMETRNLIGSGKEEERVHVLETMVHCADLSNPTKPLNQYKEWVKLVFEEFFQQGDREKESGLVVSPNCDRNNVSIEESQVAFIDYIVRPIWETWSNFVYPHTNDILTLLEENYNYYLLKPKS